MHHTNTVRRSVIAGGTRVAVSVYRSSEDGAAKLPDTFHLDFDKNNVQRLQQMSRVAAIFPDRRLGTVIESVSFRENLDTGGQSPDVIPQPLFLLPQQTQKALRIRQSVAHLD
jgi:hypothetical protein